MAGSAKFDMSLKIMLSTVEQFWVLAVGGAFQYFIAEKSEYCHQKP
jgi:hypothetical protein